ncbi:hypothetical protein OG272_15755 [Streptomyces sp. NBC_00104]|uniref:hypothetical protein n=1 Tax=Streptomyces sp. NBC_00104 TaxID=2903621 RepID=UPI003253F9C4
MLDYRDLTAVVQHHLDHWISPLTGLWPPAGDVAAALRAAHGSLSGYLASQKPHRPEHITYAEAAALDHAARLAEVLAANRMDFEWGRILDRGCSFMSDGAVLADQRRPTCRLVLRVTAGGRSSAHAFLRVASKSSVAYRRHCWTSPPRSY